MEKTTLAMEEHWPIEEELKLVDKACDQIEQILDGLVQDTACSNHAIRDLLSTVSENWSDGEQEMAWKRARRDQEVEAC